MAPVKKENQPKFSNFAVCDTWSSHTFLVLLRPLLFSISKNVYTKRPDRGVDRQNRIET